MLLALTRPSRSADLSHLDILWRQYKPDAAMFLPVFLQNSPTRAKRYLGSSTFHPQTICVSVLSGL